MHGYNGAQWQMRIRSLPTREGFYLPRAGGAVGGPGVHTGRTDPWADGVLGSVRQSQLPKAPGSVHSNMERAAALVCPLPTFPWPTKDLRGVGVRACVCTRKFRCPNPSP